MGGAWMERGGVCWMTDIPEMTILFSLLPRLFLCLPLSAVLVKPVEVCGISCSVAFAKNKKKFVESTFFFAASFLSL